MMDWAQAYDGPVYLRIVRDAVPDLFGADYTFTPGAIHRLRDGGRVSLISTGPQTGRVLAAAELLAESGIDTSVIHVPSIKPIDEPALVDAVTDADLVVTVEEHSVHGGLGGLVAEILTAAGPAPQIERIGVDDTWGESAGNDFMLDKHGLSPEKIAARVRTVVSVATTS
jgi:transketolase